MNQIICPWCAEPDPMVDTAENRMSIIRHQSIEHRAELGLVERELISQS